MIVVDASAGLAALLNAGPARAALSDQQLHVPHLVDAELANVLRRKVAGGVLADADGRRALDTWRRLGMTRHPLVPLLARMWGCATPCPPTTRPTSRWRRPWRARC